MTFFAEIFKIQGVPWPTFSDVHAHRVLWPIIICGVFRFSKQEENCWFKS